MQIQNHSGRDDTIDPYYLLRQIRSGTGGSGTTGLTYSLERKIGSNGEVYYQLVESSAAGSTTTGPRIQFGADELLYEGGNSIGYTLDRLIRRDLEVQETITALENRPATAAVTFEDINLNTNNMTLGGVVAAIAAEDFDLETIVVGPLGATALPSGVGIADAEIRVLKTENGTYYEINAYSDSVSPYKWTALYKDNTEILGWTPAYGGEGGADAIILANLQTALESHTENDDIHVTAGEKLLWNNHVGVNVDPDQGRLIFSH